MRICTCVDAGDERRKIILLAACIRFIHVYNGSQLRVASTTTYKTEQTKKKQAILRFKVAPQTLSPHTHIRTRGAPKISISSYSAQNTKAHLLFQMFFFSPCFLFSPVFALRACVDCGMSKMRRTYEFGIKWSSAYRENERKWKEKYVNSRMRRRTPHMTRRNENTK